MSRCEKEPEQALARGDKHGFKIQGPQGHEAEQVDLHDTKITTTEMGDAFPALGSVADLRTRAEPAKAKPSSLARELSAWLRVLLAPDPWKLARGRVPQ